MKPWLSSLISLVLLCVIDSFLTFSGWPGFHVDSALLATPCLISSEDGKWWMGNYTDVLATFPDRQYAYHGLLHVFVYKDVLRCNSVDDLLTACAIFDCFCLTCWWLVCMGISIRCDEKQRGWLAASVMSVVCLFLLNLHGRPEQMCLAIAALAMYAGEHKSGSWCFGVLWSIALGLMFVASPLCVSALLPFFFWSAARGGMEYQRTTFLMRLAVVGVCSLGISALFVAICARLPFTAWLGNTIRATASWSDRGGPAFADFMKVVFYWKGKSTEIPFWNLIALGSAIVSSVMLLRRLAFIPAVLLGCFTAPVLWAGKDYTIASCIPMAMMCLAGVGRGGGGLGAELKIVIGYSLVCVLFLVRSIALAGLLCRYGVTLSDSRSQIMQLVERARDSGAIVGFEWSRPSFVVCGPAGVDYISVNVTDSKVQQSLVSSFEQQVKKKLRFVVLPQQGPGKPPSFVCVENAQFSLISENWIEQPPRLMGVRMSSRYPGYQFAVYEKTAD